jgi:hypothetical protein
MKNIFFSTMIAMIVSLTSCSNNAEQVEQTAEPVDSSVIDSTQELYPAVDSTTEATQ